MVGLAFLLVFVLGIGGVAAVAVRVFAVRGGRPVAVVGNDLLAHRLVLLLVGQVVRVMLEHVCKRQRNRYRIQSESSHN